jgi:hypothetical protein
MAAILVVFSKDSKWNKKVKKIEKTIIEEEGHLQDPYLGGYNSD